MTATSVDACAPSVMQMQVTVPEGLVAGPDGRRHVSITAPDGSSVLVDVPEGTIAGEVFVASIPVSQGLDTGWDANGQSGAPETAVGGDVDVDTRIEKLSSSYVLQSKALMTKTSNIQKKRLCSNCCLCFCPLVSIALCLVIQATIVELLIMQDGMASQRCTYCGPDDAWSKVYCEGKPCSEYFFQESNYRQVPQLLRDL